VKPAQGIGVNKSMNMMNKNAEKNNYFLFIASEYKPIPGGLAECIDNLARGLIRIGNKVNILGVLPPDDDERLKFLKNYEEWVRPLPMENDRRPNSWLGNKCVSLLEIARCLSPTAQNFLERRDFFRSSSQGITKIEAILSLERPTMVIFGHLDPNLYSIALALERMNLPYGILAHDYEICRPHRINPFIIKGKMIHGASWIAANSAHTASLVERWRYSRNKIFILHPAISEQVIREGIKIYPSVRDQEYTLVTICRIVKSKGIDIVLRALKILEEKGIRYRYIVAGSGSERSSLENLAHELGIKSKVHFWGYIEDDRKWSLLRMAHVFIMPSRVNSRLSHEGFGMAFIEAAAFGIPGVGSRAGGIPDAIVHGETGLLVAQESSEELAQALIFLYQNPEKRKKIGKAAMERARSQFPQTNIAAHFQKEASKRIS